MAKQLSFSNESREALEKGVNFVANAVKVTIGPVSYTHLRAHETR